MILMAGQSNLLAMAQLVQLADAPVVIAKGGSSIADWHANGRLFCSLIPWLRDAECLWFWQGETECWSGEPWSFEAIEEPIHRRNPRLPILLGESPHAGEYADWVRIAQGKTDGVTLIPCPVDAPLLPDGRHLTPAGVVEMCQRFVDATLLQRAARAA